MDPGQHPGRPDPFRFESTGEDQPDEWPMDGRETLRVFAREWAPPAGAMRAAAAAAIVAGLAWAHAAWTPDPARPALAAKPALDATATGSIPSLKPPR